MLKNIAFEVEPEDDIIQVHTWLNSMHSGKINWIDTNNDISGAISNRVFYF